MAVDSSQQIFTALTTQHAASQRFRWWLVVGLFVAAVLVMIAGCIAVAIIIMNPSWPAGSWIAALVLFAVVATILFVKAERLERRLVQSAADSLADIVPRALEHGRQQAAERLSKRATPDDLKEPLATLVALQLAGVTPQTAAAGLLLSVDQLHLTQQARTLTALAALGVKLDSSLGSLLGAPPAADSAPGQTGQSGQSSVPQVTVSATQVIPRFTVISLADVTITDGPPQPDALQALDQVLGCYALEELQPGAIVLSHQISPPTAISGTLGSNVNVAVPVARASLSPAVAPTQKVRLLIAARPAGSTARSIVLTGVPVVDVQQPTADPATLVIEVKVEEALALLPLLDGALGHVLP